MSEAAYQEFKKVQIKNACVGIGTDKLKEFVAAGDPDSKLIQEVIDRREKSEVYLNQPGKVDEPTIVIERDFDGYFEHLVRGWIKKQREMGLKSRHHTVKIDAGPYRSDAVSCRPDGEGGILLDFYSAIRTGFGSLRDQEIQDIIEKWL